MRPLISLFLPFALAACGTRGPLELPPGPAPTPVFGKSSPAQTTGQQQMQQPDHSNKAISQ